MRLELEASDGSMKNANTTALTYLDTMTSVERVLEAWRITQLEARQEADLFCTVARQGAHGIYERRSGGCGSGRRQRRRTKTTQRRYDAVPGKRKGMTRLMASDIPRTVSQPIDQ